MHQRKRERERERARNMIVLRCMFEKIEKQKNKYFSFLETLQRCRRKTARAPLTPHESCIFYKQVDNLNILQSVIIHTILYSFIHFYSQHFILCGWFGSAEYSFYVIRKVQERKYKKSFINHFLCWIFLFKCILWSRTVPENCWIIFFNACFILVTLLIWSLHETSSITRARNNKKKKVVSINFRRERLLKINQKILSECVR